MSSPEQYRMANSYRHDDGERHAPLDVTAWDLAIVVLTGVKDTLAALIFLAKGHNNALVERKAVEMEMRASLESIL